MTALLARLLSQGDDVWISNGVLVISPKSELSVPDEWLKEHEQEIVSQIIKAIGVPAYRYIDYDTGIYGRGYPGVSLQFHSIAADESAYTIFNANLKRKRNSKHGKAGTPLPKGQFSVGRKSQFYQFWKSTGLPVPPRLSAWHDYMGNLNELIYTAQLHDKVPDRLISETLQPLTATSSQIRQAIQANSPQPKARQSPNNYQTGFPDKQLPQSHARQEIEPNPATGNTSYGNKVIRNKGDKKTSPLPTNKSPQEQTHDEWWDIYDAG